MRRIPYLSIVVLAALAGCTATPAPAPTRPAPPTTSTAAEPVTPPLVVAGGCGTTRLLRGGQPAWTASANAPGQLTYALSHEDNLFAGLFADPLRGGPNMTNPNNKILWIARDAREAKPLRLELRRTDGTGPVVTHEEPADSGPGEIYPSIVDVPSSGCWSITAEWNGHRATLELPWV